MKKPKSTRNKNDPPKFDFKSESKDQRKNSPKKRKMTEDGEEVKAGNLTDRKNIKNDNHIEISSDSSFENDHKESGTNTFGFVAMNNLGSKIAGKGIRKQASNKVSSSTGKDKNVKSTFGLDQSKSLRTNLFKTKGESEDDKDQLKSFKNHVSMSVAQEWQNDRNLDVNPNIDTISKRSKNSKNRIGSRDGSRNGGKRRKKKPTSVQSKRDKNNRSKVGPKRVIHNSRKPVLFNEFMTEVAVNGLIGMNKKAVEKNPNSRQTNQTNEEATKEMKFDESQLDEAISYRYSLADRSFFESEEEKKEGEEQENDKRDLKEENFVEIVNQDDFEKLEVYKDKFPCLTVRKIFMRIRLTIQKTALAISSHYMFDYVSLIVIVANSISLTLEDPTDPEASNTGFMATLDTIFLVLYTTEMVLKITGQGFVFNKDAYLRESWNILDFVIVASAYLQLLMSSGANLSVLRSFRVLRPLRTISGIEGLRVIVSALMKAVTLLVDTAIVLVFFFIIFSIAGTQLWTGILKQRCVNENTGIMHPDDIICGSVTCPDGYFCGKTNENPDYGVTNFDNIGYSILVVFQSVTLEGWSVIMTEVQQAFNILALAFFIPLVFIGAFFLLNLTLVVIHSKFSEEHEANKEAKKHRNYLLKKLTKEEIKMQQEVKAAFKRIRIKNRKIREIKYERRDSDNSKAEDRHRRNLKKLRDDDPFTSISINKQDSRVAMLNNGTKGMPSLRPLIGISGMKKKNGVRDPITEELSNSDNSIVNHNNIFYPSNLSANEAGEAKTGVSKERNVLYLKKGGGKIRMEGMYGITKMHDVNGNELGSHSDLLEDIGLSNDDGEVDNGTENEAVLPDSEIMFPLDSSLSENSHPDKKGSGKRKNGNTKAGAESMDKAQFCISDSSLEFDDTDSKRSPDKNKNGVERKNTNYYTGTNLSSVDNNDFRSTDKKSLFKNLTALKNSKVEELDVMKAAPGVSTKISSKIEGDSKFNPKDANKNLDDKLNKIKDFNIKNVLFAQFTKRINDMKEKDLDKSEFISDNQEDDETEEKKKDKNELNANSAELEDMEASDIQVVKKGMKIKVKKETKFDEFKNTPYEDIIVNKNDTEENYHYHKHHIEEPPPKTTVKPYNLSREMVLNEILLEGKVDDEEEEEANEEKKPEESKAPDALNKSVDEEEAQSEDKNLYLEKFKYFYRSNVIATGTISIVLTLRNTERVFDIPNP